MRIIKETSYDEMIHAWLKSESFRIKEHGVIIDQGLISHPDLSSYSENEKRKECMAHRGPILNEIPDDACWKLVEINKSDIDKLYIIPIFDWFLDTGKTFKLYDALKFIAPNRGYKGPQGNNQAIDHFNEVNRKIEYWKHNQESQQEEKVIMIGKSDNGPFTIIDGTHRAIAFDRVNYYPWQALIGISKSMISCKWYIESPAARQYLIACHH